MATKVTKAEQKQKEPLKLVERIRSWWQANLLVGNNLITTKRLALANDSGQRLRDECSRVPADPTIQQVRGRLNSCLL